MPETAPRPNLRFVCRHPAHFIAFGGGTGLSPQAPGTIGTMLAFPLYWLATRYVDGALLLALIAVLYGLGIWACHVTGRALGVADHGGMVWDEVVAFMLVLFFTPAGLYWMVAAFLLFRLFDIYKPPPIRHYDRTLKNGFGVMFDDLIAAGYALIVLAVAKTVMETIR